LARHIGDLPRSSETEQRGLKQGSRCGCYIKNREGWNLQAFASAFAVRVFRGTFVM
jgi:hypothetical protein